MSGRPVRAESPVPRPAGEIDEVGPDAPARVIEFPAGRAAREMAGSVSL